MTGRIPLAKPQPPRLSEHLDALRALEGSGTFSNFGPVNAAFEHRMLQEMFDGQGACLTVCNATIGLVIAMRQAMEQRSTATRKYALMPSFTFAAAAQAACWNGLTPLFCDIDPVTWSADPESERQLLERFGSEIAIVVPYATFGYNIDLDWYESIQRDYGIPVVVDAAASLGTRSAYGRGFGTGFSSTVVYSMHVTKSFSTGEGGLIYSADPAVIDTLRTMSSFGFGEPRSATMLGLNAKMTEVAALMATLRLDDFPAVMQRRAQLVDRYRRTLPELTYQPRNGLLQAHQFTSALLPASLAPQRATIREHLRIAGVDTGNYFSPHVAEQAYFRNVPRPVSLRVTDHVASRMLTLPLFDTMTDEDVHAVAHAVRDALRAAGRKLVPARRAPAVARLPQPSRGAPALFAR